MINNSRGFSLIELMIVVAIIGTMSMMAGPDLVKSMKTRITRNHLKSVARTMVAARATAEGRGRLMDLTGSSCSACEVGFTGGTTATNMSTYAPPAVYAQRWKTMGFDTPPKDAWGHYYILDENDGESDSGGPGGFNDCRMDALWSAGEDGVFEGLGDGDDVGGDDVVVRLPMVTGKCGENAVTGGYPL